jgi:hypothetical protein
MRMCMCCGLLRFYDCDGDTSNGCEVQTPPNTFIQCKPGGGFTVVGCALGCVVHLRSCLRCQGCCRSMSKFCLLTTYLHMWPGLLMHKQATSAQYLAICVMLRARELCITLFADSQVHMLCFRYMDCYNGASDGCETHLDSDPNNCGTCGNKLSSPNGATPTCTAGKPSTASCSPG